MHPTFCERQFSTKLAKATHELVRGGDGGVEVRQGDHIDDIGNIVALDENLKQSDRYLMMDA